MSFEKWLDKFNETFVETISNHSQFRGDVKFDKERRKLLIPEKLEEKHVKLYIAYRAEKTNKQLVWATWILAIFTIILSILTFIFR